MNNHLGTDGLARSLSRMKTYAIRWKSTVNGRIGTGNLLFEKEEAERRAAELNDEYPDIEHEAVLPVPSAGRAGGRSTSQPSSR